MTLPAFLGNSGIKNFSHGLCICTGHVFVWGTNPLSRLRRHLPPAGGSLSTQGTPLAKRADEPLPSFRFAKCHLPRRWRPWQRGQVLSSFVNGRKNPTVKLQTFCPCQSLSLSGEVARRSRDGEGCFRNEPSQSPTATARSPFCRLPATSSPGRGKSFEGRALGRTGEFRPYSSTAGRSLPLSCKLYALAKASPFRERWHGEAVTERVASGTNPLSLAALDSSPEGGALGKEGRFRPHRLLARKSLPLSCKLSALAKASPFRERWHGEAVTERVAFRLTAAFGKRFSHGPAERPSSLESRY